MVVKLEKLENVVVVEGLDKIQLPNGTIGLCAYFSDENEKKFCVTVGAFKMNDKEYYGFGIGSLNDKKYVINDLDNERIPIFCADNADEKQINFESHKMKNAIMKASKIKSDNYQEFLNKFKEFYSKEFKEELKKI